MTTSESKGRFLLQNESLELIRITNRIDSNRELECSSTGLRAPAGWRAGTARQAGRGVDLAGHEHP